MDDNKNVQEFRKLPPRPPMKKDEPAVDKKQDIETNASVDNSGISAVSAKNVEQHNLHNVNEKFENKQSLNVKMEKRLNRENAVNKGTAKNKNGWKIMLGVCIVLSIGVLAGLIYLLVTA